MRNVGIRKNLHVNVNTRIVKRHEYVLGGFERMTKELTASVPSAMKIEVVTPPDNIVFMLFLPEINVLQDRA